MIIDTHCHYNLDPLYKNWQQHWQKAQESGVKKAVVVGVNFESSSISVHLTQEKNVYAAVGYHPDEYNDEEVQKDYTQLSLLAENKKVAAIGETGLDYFRLTEDNRKKIIAAQQTAFRKHIHLAQEHELPLIIHARDKNETAYWDILRILGEEKYTYPFILHCVSGPLAYIQKALGMGAYLGMAGNVTYKNAEHLRDIVRSAPIERLLLETDAPFLPPQEFRGKTCEPWMISKTAAFVEHELRIKQEQIYSNTVEFFGGKID